MVLGTKQSEKTGRINLFVDGEFAFSVNARIFASQLLRDGDEITDEELQTLKSDGEAADAYEKGLTLLEYGDNSSRGLYRKLSQKFSAEACSSAVEKLKKNGFLNDADYAKRLAESVSRRKGYGKNRIIQELFAKGISREDAQAAVDSLETDDSEALKNAVAKLNIDFSDKKSVDKAFRKLYAMGFRGFHLGDFYVED